MLDLDKLARFHSKLYRSSYMSNRVRTAIATQVRALREQFCQTQKNFAELTGKPQSVISRLENPNYGRMSVNTLLEVAEALDIALVVKFVSYDNFFNHLDDEAVSLSALRVEPFSETAKRYQRTSSDVSDGLRKEVETTSAQSQRTDEGAHSVVSMVSAVPVHSNIYFNADPGRRSSVGRAA